jgi:hypothetical protein
MYHARILRMGTSLCFDEQKLWKFKVETVIGL